MFDSNASKKRLVIFIPEFPVVTETFIEREVVKLVERNNLDTYVISLVPGGSALNPLLAGRVVYRELTPFNLWNTLISSGAIYLRYSNKFLLLLKLVFSSNKSLIQKISLIFRTYFFYLPNFYNLKPDFILAHFLSEPSTISMLVSTILNIPYGISAHARDVFEYPDMVSEKVKTARLITLCNSRAYKRCIELNSGNNPGNILLRYHGIDFEKYLSTPVEDTSPKSELILFNNGRFTEKKGHKYLLDASSILQKENVNFHLYLLGGGGECLSSVKEQIQSLNLSNRVTIINDGMGIPFEEVVKYYRKSHMFVFPSIVSSKGDSDGIANVLIEAALFRVPIIATDAGSTTEFIEDGKNGVIVPQKDAKSLASSIHRLYKDVSLQNEFKQATYEKAKKLFDLDTNITELENIIVKV